MGRHKPLNPLRREMPDVPVDLCDRRVLLSNTGYGAAGTRHSLRPLPSCATVGLQLERIAPRDRVTAWPGAPSLRIGQQLSAWPRLDTFPTTD
jgi:hypothetical protein